MNRTIVKGCPSTLGDDVQLNTTTMIRHAARTHGDQQIVFRTPDGGWDRYTYADCYQRVCRAANACERSGSDQEIASASSTETTDATSNSAGPFLDLPPSCCR